MPDYSKIRRGQPLFGKNHPNLWAEASLIERSFSDRLTSGV